MVPSKYPSNFRRTLEVPLIDCEITLDLNWSEKCIIVATDVAGQGTTFSITDTRLYVPLLTLSTKDNAKMVKQNFKRTINWNKHRPKVSTERINQFLDFLVDPSLQGVIRLFVLSFENEEQRTSDKQYYFTASEVTNINVMINEQNVFDQPVRNDLIRYVNIREITTGQGDYYTTGCLLNYNYFKNIIR